MSDPETIRVYDRDAARYVELTRDVSSENTDLVAFIEALPPNARVLDFGCGPGLSGAVMAKAGMIVDAMDLSAEMVKLASQHDGVTARQASFDDLDADSVYDGIWASFSLLHAPRDAFPGHLAQIMRALKPGGIFFIGLKTGTGTKRDSIGRLYTYYTQEEVEGYLARAGLTVTQTRTGSSEGLDGIDAPFVTMIAHA
ncbi:class I SAM-dependent methyltransferase [Thalassococcus sp. S3]|uniref:class I SAM-dependent DNA methyltransferase n=1 Tax=Thalassococcus sp. S3 TaxID=2017482 RepID=UPI0010246FEF|nr:methyltransferase domain-containing protein [Thalassococcus sp. S3]QBF30000.1 SAM-dependent methyltransferase [Thalassococcus sp. S3]